jgi:hypothetical protein
MDGICYPFEALFRTDVQIVSANAPCFVHALALATCTSGQLMLSQNSQTTRRSTDRACAWGDKTRLIVFTSYSVFGREQTKPPDANSPVRRLGKA